MGNRCISQANLPTVLPLPEFSLRVGRYVGGWDGFPRSLVPLKQTPETADSVLNRLPDPFGLIRLRAPASPFIYGYDCQRRGKVEPRRWLVNSHAPFEEGSMFEPPMATESSCLASPYGTYLPTLRTYLGTCSQGR